MHTEEVYESNVMHTEPMAGQTNVLFHNQSNLSHYNNKLNTS